MSDFKMSNNVHVTIYGGSVMEAAPIVFDLRTNGQQHHNVGGNSLYQNLSIEDAKRIRKWLKAAIKQTEGK